MKTTFPQRLKYSFAFGGWRKAWRCFSESIANAKDGVTEVLSGVALILLGPARIAVSLIGIPVNLVALVVMPFYWAFEVKKCEFVMEKLESNGKPRN